MATRKELSIMGGVMLLGGVFAAGGIIDGHDTGKIVSAQKDLKCGLLLPGGQVQQAQQEIDNFHKEEDQLAAQGNLDLIPQKVNSQTLKEAFVTIEIQKNIIDCRSANLTWRQLGDAFAFAAGLSVAIAVVASELSVRTSGHHLITERSSQNLEPGAHS